MTDGELSQAHGEAKSELSGLTLAQEASQKDREGGARNSGAADLAEALCREYEHCEKCVAIGGGPGKKIFEVKFIVAITVFCL
jgi:hypothetical protein